MKSVAHNPMDDIWDNIPKQPDGKTIRYLKHDIDYLYHHGFVDSRQFSIEQWKAAFKAFEQPNGDFILNREQFLTLTPFRYIGPVFEPFDAKKIREGAWTDAQLQELYDRSIMHVSELPADAYWAYFNTFKKNPVHLDANGQLIMTDSLKFGLSQLIDTFPSPRTRLEREVARLRDERTKTMQSHQKNRGASGFTVGTTESEVTLSSLKNLETRSAPKDPPTKPTSGPGVDVKKLRKPKGKIFG